MWTCTFWHTIMDFLHIFIPPSPLSLVRNMLMPLQPDHRPDQSLTQVPRAPNVKEYAGGFGHCSPLYLQTRQCHARSHSHNIYDILCRQKIAQEGADALPARIVIVTGKNRSKEDEAGTAAKEAVVEVLGACQSPFQVSTVWLAKVHRTQQLYTGLSEGLCTRCCWQHIVNLQLLQLTCCSPRCMFWPHRTAGPDGVKCLFEVQVYQDCWHLCAEHQRGCCMRGASGSAR